MLDIPEFGPRLRASFSIFIGGLLLRAKHSANYAHQRSSINDGLCVRLDDLLIGDLFSKSRTRTGD